MAVDFSKYLDVAVESIDKPKPLPIAHYFADIKGWKGAERDYKNGEGLKPVVEVSFAITSADEDADLDLMPEGGCAGRIVTRDYSLDNENGPYMLRRLGEEICGLPVKGLSLGDMLPMLIKQPVKLFVTQRPSTKNDDIFPQVDKVLPAN